MKSLHPNLARIALRYDETINKFNEGQLDAKETLAILQTLVARDDNGVLWAINPQSGSWVYKNMNNEFVVGQPPVYGIAGLKAIDLDSKARFDNDWNISNIEIDQSLIYPIGSLNGSTYLENLKNQKRGIDLRYAMGIFFLVAIVAITYKFA